MAAGGVQKRAPAFTTSSAFRSSNTPGSPLAWCLLRQAFSLSMGMVREIQCEPSTLDKASQSTYKFILLSAKPRPTNTNHFSSETSLHLQSCTKQLPLFHFSTDEQRKPSGPPSVRGGTTPRGIDLFQQRPEGQHRHCDPSSWPADTSDQPTSQATDLEPGTFPLEVENWMNGQQDGWEILLLV